MFFAGVDFGKRKFEMRLVDDHDKTIGKSETFKNHPNSFKEVLSSLEKHVGDVKSIIFGLETAGNFWITFAKFLDNKKIKWYPIHPTRTYHLREAEAGGSRTDPIDSRLIAMAARSDYYNKSKQATTIKNKSVQPTDELKELTRLRELILRHNESYKKSLNASVFLTFPGYMDAWGRNYSETCLRILEKFPSWNRIVSVTEKSFIQVLTAINKTALNRARDIYKLAGTLKNSSTPSQGELRKINYLIPLIILIDKELKQLDKEIETILEKKHEELEVNFQKIKGIGQVTESKTLAEIGDINRFITYKKFVSYCGTIPIPNDSAETKKKRKVKRNCNGTLRSTMISAAVFLIKSNPTFRALYMSKIRNCHDMKNAKRKARLYIANKFARIVYHLLKTKEPYDPCKMLGAC